MAKAKNSGGVQNKAIYSRVSFLQQAAVLLSATPTQQQSSGRGEDVDAAGAATGESGRNPKSLSLQGMGRRLVTDLRSVSLKTRIRLSPAVKQTICKFCDSVFIEGETCTSTIENRSKGGRKPWADVLVRRCHACQKEKRYPVSAPRPKRKTERGEAVKKGEAVNNGDETGPSLP